MVVLWWFMVVLCWFIVVLWWFYVGFMVVLWEFYGGFIMVLWEFMGFTRMVDSHITCICIISMVHTVKLKDFPWISINNDEYIPCGNLT